MSYVVQHKDYRVKGAAVRFSRVLGAWAGRWSATVTLPGGKVIGFDTLHTPSRWAAGQLRKAALATLDLT